MSIPPEIMQQQLAQGGPPPAQGGEGTSRGIRGEGPLPPSDAVIDEETLVAEMQEAMRVASNILYEDKVFNALAQMAAKAGVPEALSVTTVKILMRVQMELGELSMEILFGTAMAIIADAADALQQGGIEVGEKAVNQGLQMAITRYLEENPNQFSKEDLQRGFAGLQEGLKNLDLAEIEGGAADGGAPKAGLMGER